MVKWDNRRGGVPGLAAVVACCLSAGPAGAQPMPGHADAAPSAVVAALAPAAGRPADVLPASEPTEPALREALQQALWPADIVRLAADYLRLYPQQAAAAEVAALHQRAQRSAQLLRRSDVQLFRAAFAPPAEGAALADDLRRAALGDAAAALRQAQRALPADAGNRRRQVGWLQYAASLGSEQAAYALALHYRRESQPLLAAQYEARAVDLGFVPPPALDHQRK